MTVRMFVRLSCDNAGCGVVLMTEKQSVNNARAWARRHLWDYFAGDFCPDHNTPAKRREADRARAQARSSPPTIAAGSMASDDRGDDGDFDDRD